MEKNRLEAFSDGVLAIIITIMILELKQPAGDSIKDFTALRPILLSYILSFVFISIYWINHHLIFQKASSINVKILWCNIAWLFTMSFIPFATAWAGTYPTSFAPLFIYFTDMSLASITFHIMYYLIACECGEKEEFRLSARNIISLITYFLAAVLGGFSPVIAYIVVTAVTCWWIFPEKSK